MFPIRVKTVQESDLRMLGDLARSIQRVLPVTQADIDAAAALGKGWVVTRVFEVSDPLDNLRGGTQLVIRQNSILPGQSVQRVLIVSGPGGQTVVIRGTDYIVLPDAIANSLSYVKAFGGTEQRNIPQPYTQVNYVTNTAQTAVNTGVMIDFAKNYEFEVECRAVSGSWYMLQSRASSSGNITGIHGATSGNTITLVVGNVTVCTSAITRTVGNKLYVKATLNAGTATLYVKDETANTEDTQTGSYGTTQPNPTAAVYLLGNAGGQYVDVNSDIYMARIKENDTVVMDYVPARQVATAGFYDTVSGTFKTAETPANLSADGNTVPTPDAPMDIVSNNGVLKYGQYGKNLFNKDGTLANGYYKSADGDWVANASFRTQDYIKASPNTDYTLSVTNLQNGGNSLIMSAWDSEHNWLGTVASTTAGGDAGTSATITGTTPPNTFYLSVSFAIAYRDINTLQIEKGSTATPYEPYYFGIYTDGTVETIRIRTKNLLDNDACRAYTTEDDDVPTSRNGWVLDLPAGTYRISQNDTGTTYLRTYENGEWSAYTTVTPQISRTITLADATKIYLYGGASVSIDAMKERKVQVEVGSTTTDYQPYFDGGTATAEMLLKVGDYQDEQEILSGAVTRNVGVKVFDGTEDWKSSVTSKFYIENNYMRNYNRTPVFCTHYVAVLTSSTSGVGFGKIGLFASAIEGTSSARLVIGDDNYTSVADFKAFLANQYAAGTPVIVIYPVRTPTTESVTGQTLQVTDGDNILEITQASLTGLELEAEYQAAVSLTIQEVEDANLDNNVEVTIS